MTWAGGRRSRLFGGGAAALAIVVLGLPAAAQAQGSAARSRDAWHRVAQRAPAPGHRVAVAPTDFTSFGLDRALLAAEARRAPRAGAGSPVVLSIPQPDGSFARFGVTRGTTLSSKLAARHPKIRDYVGVGVDDRSASLSLMISPQGAFAAIRGRDGTSYVEPRYRDDATAHVAFAREALPNTDPLHESEEIARLLGSAVPRSAPRPGPGEDVPLRTYRLALINDPTYATLIGGSVLAAKAELMARVNQIYRQDLGITMTLIPQTDALNLNTDAEAIQPDGPCGGAACYTSTQLMRCSDSTLTRTTIVAGQIAGARNYDIGHLLLGDGGGGLAAPGVGDFNKAEGCTGGGGSPTGDAFGVDFVAHEMGHQFGAHHTYNGTSGDCTTRIDASAMEPGSGSTIMAYAGLCGADNLQPHTDPYFSQRSQTQMYGWVDAPAVDRENPPLSSVQRVSLRDFDGTDSFDISYGGRAPETITNGTNYTLDGIKTAIDAAIGGGTTGTTVTVTNWQGEGGGALDQNGFTVTFDSDVDEPRLVLSNFSGASGFVGDAVVGGPRNNGGAVTTTPNKAPAVQTAPGFTIPVRTPFTLMATGSDANPADTLTYLWEQSDPGTGLALGTEPGTIGPLFRVFGVAQRTDTGAVYNSTPKNATTTNPARDFPDVAQVMADNTDAVNDCGSVTTDAGNDCWSEYLPKVNRTMTFRVTARDGNPEAGGTGFADTALTVSAAAGPFRLTSQATNTNNGTSARLPVTWSVAGTDAAPVSTSNVRILLSTDDGASFPTVLAASTPNDGSERVRLPAGVQTTTGRIRIEAVGNVFYDASRGQLSFDRSQAPSLAASPSSASFGSVTVGQLSNPTSLSVTNNGGGGADLGTVAVSGPDAGQFAIVADGCSGGELAASGGSCPVSVRFAPTSAGSKSATLTAPDLDGGSTNVSLTGTGVGTTPSTPTPAPPPTAATVRLTGARTQNFLRARAVAVKVTVDRDAALSATGSIALGKARAAARLRLRPATGRAVAGRTTTLRLRLTSRNLRKLRAAVRAKRRATANVSVRVMPANAPATVVKTSIRHKGAVKPTRPMTMRRVFDVPSPMSPERQSSLTIDWATAFGLM